MEFINEIKTGKRKINKKITNILDNLFVISIIGMMFLLTLEVLGIDLIGIC